MKKKTATTQRAAVTKTKPADLVVLITEVRDLIQSARRSVASVVDTFQVMTNFEIGRRIVEHEQKGAKRAAYGAELLRELSGRLTEEFGRGFSERNLRGFRSFFLIYEDRLPKIWQTPSAKLQIPEIPQSQSGQLALSAIPQTPSAKFDKPFTLSWSHYVELLGIKDPDERSFYEIESRQSNWNVRELKRQKASCLYERLALSRDKAGIKRLAREGQLITKCELLRPRSEAARGKSHHRPADLQGEERHCGKAHSPEGRQYPRERIPALFALQGTAPPEAPRLVERSSHFESQTQEQRRQAERANIIKY
jgi:hypothetical protein